MVYINDIDDSVSGKILKLVDDTNFFLFMERNKERKKERKTFQQLFSFKPTLT